MADDSRIALTNDDRSSAPFNMALATLEKIQGILKSIVVISSGHLDDDDKFLTPGKSQHMKYRLVNQLFVQCIPLFDKKKTEEWKPEMLARIRNVKLKVGNKYSNRRVVGNFAAYDEDVEQELDDIIMEIQERLQDEGYFMPPKNDARFSWKQV